MSLASLRDLLAQHFNNEELRQLCFNLTIEYENLRGETRPAKAQALVEHCLRHQRLPDLGKRCRELRPAVEWPDLDVLASELDKVQGEIAVREKLVGILSEAELSGLLAPLQQQRSELLTQLIGDGVVAYGEGAKAVGQQGVLVEGDVGGDVTTGQKNVVYRGTQNIYQTVPKGESLTATEWESSYLNALQAHCSELDLTLLDASEARSDRLDIATVFTTLYLDYQRFEGESLTDVLLNRVEQKKWRERDSGLHERELLPIAATEAIAAVSRLVILGQPGGGKSTLVNHVVTQLAARRLDATKGELPHWPTGHTPLPVRIVLRRFASWLTQEKRQGAVGDVWDYLQQLLKGWGCGHCFTGLQKAVRDGDSIIFFDGLDELRGEGMRKTVIRGAVEKFAKIEKGCQVVVTSRPYAYETDTAWRLPDDEFVVVQLAPFAAEQIEAFNEAWYTKVIEKRRGWPVERCQQAAARLSRTILARPHLLRLARSPLLLTLIAQVDSSGGGAMQLNNRAELYQKTVNLLLARWENRIQLDVAFGEDVPDDQIVWLDGLPTHELRDVLAKLAYEGHRDQAQQQQGEADADLVVEIAYATLQQELLLRFDSLQRANDIIAYIQQRTGLLVDKGGYLFTFPHRTYQEYLAGQHLQNMSGWQPRLVKLLKQAPDWWREVFLLSVAGKPADSVQFLVQALLPIGTPTTQQEINLLFIAAQALVETNFNYYVELEAKQAEPPEADGFDDFLQRVQALLIGAMLAEAVVPAIVRAEAGRWLGYLGDPRPGVGVDPVTELPDIVWGEEVPAGRYVIGADREAYGSFEEQEVEIKRPFRLSRYPITNAQFQAFVQAPDWDQPRWWRGMPANEQQFDQPRFPYANHPRETVSWYQAIAFCRWLTMQLAGELPAGAEIELPHEYEWEVAARYPDGSLFPWGNEFEAKKANTFEGGVNQTTAVGLYPSGRNVRLSLYDLSGNIFEWCLNKYEKLQETAVDKEWRAVHGGSWDFNRSRARAASRSNYDPRACSFSIGFRVVLRCPIGKS